MLSKIVFNITRKTIVVFLVFWLSWVFVYSQNTGVKDVISNLHDYNKNFPQQKVYLHLDKNNYYPGENIWAKAYLVNAATHKPDTLSNNLFVELSDSKDKNISAMVLKLDNGMAEGDIQIPDSVPDGNYTVRAYTTWMLNFNKDLIFKAPVYIENPEEENYISWIQARENRKFNRKLKSKEESFTFDFYPEGGNIIAESLNRVAFKANNELGGGVEVEGIIKTENGDKVTGFESKHLGMGYFEYNPVKGKRYYAKVTFPDGSQERFNLPRPNDSGFVLRVDNFEDSDEIQISIEAAGDVGHELALIATTRGVVKFFDEFSLDEQQAWLTIPKDKFDTGISQITLFDNNVMPVAERLVFINNHDYLNIKLEESTLHDDNAENIVISIADNKGHPVEGTFSMGVVKIPEASDIPADILSELLINSDLKGYIEKPDYYFDDENTGAHKALDVLMLTHGWRRFDLEKIASGDFPEIKHELVSGLSVEGKVTMPSSRRGVGFAKVEMMVHGDAEELYHAEADKDGYFAFSELEYVGPFKAEFSANRRDLGSNFRIEIESTDFLKKEFDFNVYTNKHNITGRGDDWERISRRPNRDDYKDDPGFSPSAGSDNHYLSNPDQVIYLENIKMPYSTLGEVLRGRITGLQLDPGSGQLMIRGPSSIMGSSQPAFFIDQIQIDQSRFLLLNPNDIDRVEVYKGASAAILGVRGANGAILAYSKRGGVEFLRTYIYQFMGYYSPREFYVQGDEELERQRKHGEYQTLLWDSNLKKTDDGKVTINFHKDMEPGKYKIRIEGMDYNGRLGSFAEIIEID